MKHRMTEGMAVAIIGPMIGDGGVLTRYLTRLDALLTQYYTIHTWTASGDFEIEFDAVITTGINQKLIGDTADNSSIAWDANDNVAIRIGFSWYVVGAYPQNSKFNRWRVTRVGSLVSVFIAGNLVGTASTSAAMSFDLIGSRISEYTTGYIANVSLQTAGDNRLYKFDENFGETSVVKNSLATLGSELASNIFIDIDTVNGFENFGVTNISAALVYLCEMEVESVTAGTIRLNTNGNTSSNISEPDTVSLTASGSTFARLQSGAGGFTGRVKLSVKQADGYGTAKNLAESTDFVFDGAVSPNTWTDIPTGLIVLEVAGT